MTTRPPAAVQEFNPKSLEQIAYTSVNSIPTEEPNDRVRLGYHVWRWLSNREGSLYQAIIESRARLHIQHQEALEIISEAIMKQGISLA